MLSNPFAVRISDTAFETVSCDIQAHPMSSMRACSRRTGYSYSTVLNVVHWMIADGTMIRRRIGQRPGIGLTFANHVVTER